MYTSDFGEMEIVSGHVKLIDNNTQRWILQIEQVTVINQIDPVILSFS